MDTLREHLLMLTAIVAAAAFSLTVIVLAAELCGADASAVIPVALLLGIGSFPYMAKLIWDGRV